MIGEDWEITMGSMPRMLTIEVQVATIFMVKWKINDEDSEKEVSNEKNVWLQFSRKDREGVVY